MMVLRDESARMCRLLLLPLLLVQLSSVCPRSAEGQRSHVMDLTADTLDPAIEKYDIIMVEFYAPWCGHCKHLAPEYEKASQLLFRDAPRVKLARIDADKYKTSTSKYKIDGYPTLRLYTNGIPTEPAYDGRRTAEAIVSYMKRAIVPAVSTLTTESELTGFVTNVSDNSPIFIGFGLETSVLEDLASRHKRKAWFAVIQDFSAKAMVDFDFDKKPALVGLHPKLEEQAVFYGPFESTDMGDFVLQHLLPTVSFVDDTESLKRLKEDGRPIAIGIVVSRSESISRSFIQKLKAAAPANRGFVFAYVETSKAFAFVQAFGIKKASVLPTVVIWDGESHFSNSDNVEAFIGADAEAQLTKFLQDFRDGRAMLRDLVQGSLLQRGRKLLFGLPSMLFVCLVIILVLVLQGWHWTGLPGDGDHADEHRDRGKRTDLEGDVMVDRVGDSVDPLYFSRKSEKRD